MKNIFKKLTALAVSIVMLFAMAPFAEAKAYTVEDAYRDCASMYPEFVDAILSNGATEENIIRFLYGLQEYLLNQNTEITPSNIESYMLEGINDLFNKRMHIKLRNAVVAAYPGAVLDGADGIISPEFMPLVETVKNIIFENDMLDGDNETDEPTTDETTTDEPTTEPESESKEQVTEPVSEPTERETKPNKDNTTGGNGGFDDGEDVTEPKSEPTEKPTEPKVVFKDLSEAQWAEKAVNSLVAMGVIDGYPDGTFKPNNPVTRAELAKIVVMTSGRYKPNDETYSSAFTDVLATAWEYPYVSAAYKFGFIKGRSETIFDPSSNITRADVCLIAYRYIQSINSEFKAKTNPDGTAYTFADIASVPEYAREAVTALYSNGIVTLRDSANNKFEPLLPATRAECAYIIYNATNAALGL